MGKKLLHRWCFLSGHATLDPRAVPVHPLGAVLCQLGEDHRLHDSVARSERVDDHVLRLQGAGLVRNRGAEVDHHRGDEDTADQVRVHRGDRDMPV